MIGGSGCHSLRSPAMAAYTIRSLLLRPTVLTGRRRRANQAAMLPRSADPRLLLVVGLRLPHATMVALSPLLPLEATTRRGEHVPTVAVAVAAETRMPLSVLLLPRLLQQPLLVRTQQRRLARIRRPR